MIYKSTMNINVNENDLMVNDQLRKALKDLRTSLRINQQGFADIIGVARPTYTKIESGTIKEIKAKHLKKLCDKFHVSFERLAEGIVENTKEHNYPPDIQQYVDMVVDILQSNDHKLAELLRGTISNFHRTLDSNANSGPTISPKLPSAAV